MKLFNYSAFLFFLFLAMSCVYDEVLPELQLTEIYAPDYIKLEPGISGYSLSVESEINGIVLTGKVNGPFDYVEINYERTEHDFFDDGRFVLQDTFPLVHGKNQIQIAFFRNKERKVYYFEVHRKSTASASLKSLQVSNGNLTPSFASTISKYTIGLNRDIQSVAIDATPFDERATVTYYSDSLITDGRKISLHLGDNLIRVRVTSHEGHNEKEYQIIIHRRFLRSAELDEIVPNHTMVSQARDGNNLEMSFPYSVAEISLNVKLKDSLSTYKIANTDFSNYYDVALPLKLGVNRFKLVVVADDAITETIYNIEITRSPWYLVKDRAAFTPRDGALVTVFKNKLWVIDGWSWLDQYSTTNIWSSSDGWTWQHVANVPWKNKHAVTPVVFQDKIWVISDGNNDVWNSEDGINWVKVTDDAPWGYRYSPYIFSFNNKLWLMGGISWWDENGIYVYPETGEVKTYNDVWSSDDGLSWTKVLDHAPWEGRAMSHGSPIFKNKMWIVGGGVKASETIAAYNDIWTTSDGVNWDKVADAQWERRYHFSVAVHDNKLWICDGSVYPVQSNRSNEVWYSDDGVDWSELKGTPWVPRHASNLVSFRGSLFLMNGSNRDGLVLNDIWKLEDINY